MDQFATYSKFRDAEDASFLMQLLREKEIPYETVQERNQLDHIYLGESIDPMFAINIPRDKFSVVNSLFEEKATNDFSSPHFNHYLHEFNDKELKDVIQDSDSWNPYDVQIAKLILQGRSGAPLQQVDMVREEELVGEQIKTEWLVLGYAMIALGLLTMVSTSLISLFILAGIFIGSSIAYSKKTSSNGQSIFIYDPQSRKRGVTMIVIGIVILIVTLYIKFTQKDSF